LNLAIALNTRNSANPTKPSGLVTTLAHSLTAGAPGYVD
jgi:hypothetical protein